MWYTFLKIRALGKRGETLCKGERLGVASPLKYVSLIMILTVTLNPCIDRTLTVSNFREGGTTPVSATRTEIGGKGLNVSRALKNLGAPTLCLGFSHEKGGSDIKTTLDEVSISYDLE